MMRTQVSSWLLGVALVACQSECVLNDDLRTFAGSSARDCGTAALGGERSDVDACVAEAFDAGAAFLARYEQMGVDSKVVTAVAMNSDGEVKLFQWDSAPCGGPGCDPVTDVQSCENPSLNPQTSEDPDALPVSCEGRGSPERVCG